MGMAASQARFLGLTARKTNVEYQGQQVNQQRASLANESAGLYNQMVNLKLPLPPSAVNFYSSRYTFESAALDNSFSIVNFDRDYNSTDGNYLVTMQYKAIEREGFTSTVIPSKTSATAMTVGNDEYVGATTTADNDLRAVIKLMNPNGIGNSGNPITEAEYTAEAAKFTKFTAAKDASSKTAYYALTADLGKTDPPPTLYYAKDHSVTKTAKAWADLSTNDSTNSSRFTSINLKRFDTTDPEAMAAIAKALGVKFDATTGQIEDGSKKTFDLEVKKAEDNDGYEEATKEYEYQKMLYDRSIQDINAKTESIQQQDKNLELKLRQLDTEQKAIQTEMEAVQKVIQKNVETTFKTFG